MIQVDVPAAFVCSQVFAWSGRRWLPGEPASWLGRYTAITFAYAIALVGAGGLRHGEPHLCSGDRYVSPRRAMR